MEDEWEEEEQLVVVELSGIINNDFMSKFHGTCKILDIDSDRPMMQVGQYVFAGEYNDAMGTCVLFEEHPPKGRGDSCPTLKYSGHTVKKLMMQRIFLTEKREGETSTEAGSKDSGEQNNTTCQSNEEETARQQEKLEEALKNTNLDDSAVG